jgi:aspartate/methionine/tyrosine aminotransferase
VNFIGAKPVPLRLREDRDFGFDLDEFASLVNDKTKFVVLNSPQNPTGGVITRSDLEKIAHILRDRDLYVLSDEIYCSILYEGRHDSITTFSGFPEKTIILDGHSKTYAMTGWRLGYGVMPKDLAVHVTRLMTNSNSCTNVFVQRAGMAALTGPQDEVTAMVAEFKRRRDVIVEGLNRIPGVSCRTPKGAFYVFPNVQGVPMDSSRLARELLDVAGVAVLSGTAFGAYGNGYLRLSYANSVENIRKALTRMSEFITSIKA